MKYESPIFSQASGSIGGMTFTHGPGGLIVRARHTPTNPASVRQRQVTALMSQAAGRWVSILTEPMRDAWRLYASQVGILNTLGKTIYLSGNAMYNRCNIARRVGEMPWIDAGPTEFTLGDFTQPSCDPNVAEQHLITAWNNSDEWATDTAAAFIGYCSAPQNPTIMFFKGPYRYFGRTLGNAGSPPTTPWTTHGPYPFVAGQKLFLKYQVSRSDGRLSAPLFCAGVAA